MIAQHVHHANRRQGNGEQLRTLLHHRTDKQAAVGSTHDAERGRRGVLLAHEIFGRCDEVVEHVLLAIEHAGLVPRLAVLASAAHVRGRPDAPALEPRRHIGPECRQRRNVEAAVPVEHRRVGAVADQIFLVGHEHRHSRAVLRVEEDTLGRIELRIEGELRRLERHAGGGRRVEAKYG